VGAVGGLDTSNKRKDLVSGGNELRSLRLPTRSLTAIPTEFFRLSYNSGTKAAPSLNINLLKPSVFFTYHQM
jgi:hypothetical protein